jgi:hypothetical protein
MSIGILISKTSQTSRDVSSHSATEQQIPKFVSSKPENCDRYVLASMEVIIHLSDNEYTSKLQNLTLKYTKLVSLTPAMFVCTLYKVDKPWNY